MIFPISILGVFLIVALWASYRFPMWVVMFLVVWLPFESTILSFINSNARDYFAFMPEALMFVLLGSLLVGVSRGKYNIKTSNMNMPFMLLVVAIVASIFAKELFSIPIFFDLTWILPYIALFYAVWIMYPRRFWIKRIVLVMFAIALLQSLIASAQVVAGPSLDAFLAPLTDVGYWDPSSRAFGTLGHSEKLGAFLSLSLLLALGCIYEGGRKRDWLKLGWMWIVVVPALLSTFSYSAWLGLVLGGFVIAVFRKDRRVVAWYGAVVLLFATAITFFGAGSNVVLSHEYAFMSELHSLASIIIGSIGIALLFLVFAVAFRSMKKIAEHSKISETRALSSGLLVVLVMVVVAIMFESILALQILLPFVFLLTGCAMVSGDREKLIKKL